MQSMFVVYFEQLLGAVHTQKLVKLLFFSCFQPFLLIFNLFQWFHGGNQHAVTKNQPKKDNFEVPPQGVNQLLHVDQLWGVDKKPFFCSFSDVFCWFYPKAGQNIQHMFLLTWIKNPLIKSKNSFSIWDAGTNLTYH